LDNAIKETSYKVFTGLTEGIFKVLSDPGVNTKQDKELRKSPAITASWEKGGRTAIDTLSETSVAKIRGKARSL
jgi:hypothetical protein